MELEERGREWWAEAQDTDEDELRPRLASFGGNRARQTRPHLEATRARQPSGTPNTGMCDPMGKCNPPVASRLGNGLRRVRMCLLSRMSPNDVAAALV